MSNVRLPKALCAVVAEVLSGSHKTLEGIFEAAGVPGPPPDLPHHSKWKEWLFRAGNDPSVDTLALIGNLIEEFMDLPPTPSTDTDAVFGVTFDPLANYQRKRDRLNSILEEHGFQYLRGGRVLPKGGAQLTTSDKAATTANGEPQRPSSLEELLQTIIRGLPRAMHPLIHRRKGVTVLAVESEYEIQDLLHSQLRPWIADIRPRDFT